MEEKKNGNALKIRRGFAYIVLIIITFLCLFSFYILLINSTRGHVDIQKGFSFLPGTYLWKNFKAILGNQNLPVVSGVINSLIVASASSVLSVYFSALTAYAIHCYEFKGKQFIFTFILLIMTVPSQVSALGFVRLMRTFKMLDTFWPLIIPSIAAPVVFFYMKQYMEASLPIEIVEAARIDGSNEFKTFNSIILPILKPAMAVQMIFGFTTSWNNFFIPNLIITKNKLNTLPILIAKLRGADFLKFDMGQVYIMIALSIFPVVIIYLALSKYIVQGVALGSVKG